MEDYTPPEDTVEVELSREELLHAIRHDCATVLAFYLEDELTLEVPDFHDEAWNHLMELLDRATDPMQLTGILKKMIGIPREHAKTTLIKLAMVIFLRYSPFGFLAYVSKTHGSAVNAIKDIKRWFMSKQDADLYGPTESIKSTDNEGIYELKICVPGKKAKKHIIMRAYGQQSHMRGANMYNRRPDLLVFDDIEDQDTLEPAVQAKLDKWAFGTAMKAMAKKGIAIFIGNMLAETSLLARIAKNPKWDPIVFGAIIQKEDGGLRPLWEGRWTLEALLEDYREYREMGLGASWEAEMMNLTSDQIFGVSLEKASKIPSPSPEDVTAGFICLDPAFGKKSWHDESAITVHVHVAGTDIPFVVAHRVGRMTEEQLFDAMLEMSYYWGLTTWVIEAQAAQRLLISLFKLMFRTRFLPEDMFTLLPVYAGKEAKASRIIAGRNMAASGSYGFADDQTDLITKLEQYVPGGEVHDDLCDSFAYGTQVWAMHGTIIKVKGRYDVIGAIASTYGASGENVDEMTLCPH